MKVITRAASLGLVLALFVSLIPLSAQEDEAITVTGSQTVVELVDALADASSAPVALSSSITGTTSGLAAFCAGESDMTGASRPISVDEEAVCLQNDIAYGEYLLAYDALIFIAHPDLDFSDCLSQNTLSTLFAPSATNTVTEWSQVGIGATGTLSLHLPNTGNPLYALLDEQVAGLDLRTDVQQYASYAEIADAVASTPGAMGVVPLSIAQQADGVQLLEVRNETLDSCYAPSLETIEGRQYELVNRLFLYVNQSSLGKTGLSEFLGFATGTDAAEVVSAQQLSQPSDEFIALNTQILAGELEPGRQFSQEIAAFQIPVNVAGPISIGGSARLQTYLEGLTTTFQSRYPSATASTELKGEPEGIRRLCNGELDFLATTYALSAEELEACDQNNVTTLPVDLGSQAVVLVANAEDNYLECLTTEEVFTTWATTSADTVLNWSDVNPEYPETAMTLFAPEFGSSFYDSLMLVTDGPALPVREDVQENNDDILYRAAATANVNGALTYMSWQEYQSVLESGQANIQLVAIDDGSGCQTASIETIKSGAYPYALQLQLLVNQDTLANSQVQSLLWFAFEDANYTLFESADMIPALLFADLPLVRDSLQDSFAAALAASLEPDPEVTPEATAEATPEVTAEAEQ